jgi:hypothetical protein
VTPDRHRERVGLQVVPAQRYAPWLWLLSLLFVLRVVAQPAALGLDTSFLPRFDEWHSGVVPYPLLLVTQLCIVVWLVRTAWRFTAGSVAARRGLGIAMVAFGGVYLAIMLARLVLGATLLSSQRWFARPLPTVFHIVLATYVLVYGDFHTRYGSSPSRGPLEWS